MDPFGRNFPHWENKQRENAMLKSNYYSLYVDSVLRLAETIVIKSQITADAQNRELTDYFGADAVDPTDLTSWRYYRNLSGQYHPRDETMYVTSMDTLERIPFDRATLEIHRATKRGYAYGTRQYKELLSQYPKQERLILGILYPVDIHAAIKAPDYKILGYPSGLVEPNEYSLINKLQNWIDYYGHRWCNNQYAISDELYPAVSLGLMYTNLVPAIMTLRLEACKTSEAHSFHVRQYLASHGMLDVYVDQMTLRQSLFFYRNIAYIERNSGQTNIFEWLVEHIMTERNLPIAEYEMRHNHLKQPDELYPAVTFRRNPLNMGMVADPLDTKTLDQLLEKEDLLARGNPDARTNHEAQIQAQFENSLSNVLETKVLESEMVDYSNATPYTLEDTLVNHWLWLSSVGLYYQAVVAVNNPKTGERIPMVVKDAYVFMWYAFCRSMDIELETVPTLVAKRVQRLPLPTVSELYSIVDHKLVERSVAVEALSLQPTIPNMVSTEAFYNKCVEINDACQMQRRLIATQEHYMRRGYVHSLVSRIYSDNLCQLAPLGTTYEDWFAERNIKIDDFTREDFELAYVSLTRDATGLSLTSTTSVRELQASMLRMLGQLSSYTVQFVKKINETDIVVTDTPAVRVGDRDSALSAKTYVADLMARVVKTRSKLKAKTDWDVGGENGIGASIDISGEVSTKTKLEIVVKAHEANGPAIVYNAFVNTSTVYGKVLTVALPNAEGFIPLPGTEILPSLTFDDRATLRDVWRHNWPVWPTSDAFDLSIAIRDPFLNGLDLP